MALLAALIDTLAEYRCRAILSVPFPDIVLRNDSLRSKSLTMCSMRSHDRYARNNSAVDGITKVPLYNLIPGITSRSEDIRYGLETKLKQSSVSRACRVRSSIECGVPIPVDFESATCNHYFSHHEMRYLRDFLA